MQYKLEIWELENDNRRLLGSEEQARGEGSKCDIIFIWWGGMRCSRAAKMF